MIDVNEYEIYKTIEDLPVKTLCVKPDAPVVVRGVIQILHGMCEYKERYLDFIKFMNENGYICVINDMCGHGENVSFFKELGYFGSDGAEKLIDSTHAVTVYIKNNFPDLPLILLGHSMGSFIAKAMLKRYDDDYDKVMLLGSPSNRIGKRFGMFLADILSLIGDEKKTSKLMDMVIMGPYWWPYRSEKSPNAWICSDENVVNGYSENMYSNFTFTINGYYTLLEIMCEAYSKKNWKLKNKRMPIIFMAGEGDPCIYDEKHFKKSAEHLRDLGYFHVETKLYENMRHEILNEKNKMMVYKDIVEWLKEDEDNLGLDGEISFIDGI